MVAQQSGLHDWPLSTTLQLVAPMGAGHRSGTPPPQCQSLVRPGEGRLPLMANPCPTGPHGHIVTAETVAPLAYATQ